MKSHHGLVIANLCGAVCKGCYGCNRCYKRCNNSEIRLKTGFISAIAGKNFWKKDLLASRRILCGCAMIRFLETLGEIGRIIKPNQVSDLRNVRIRLAQQFRGHCESLRSYKVCSRKSNQAFEFSVQLHAAHSDFRCEFFDREIAVGKVQIKNPLYFI